MSSSMGAKPVPRLQQHLTPEPRPVPGTYYTLNKYLLHKRITETVKNLHHHHRIKQHTTAPAAFKTHTVDPQEAKFKEYQTWLINTALKKKKNLYLQVVKYSQNDSKSHVNNS